MLKGPPEQTHKTNHGQHHTWHGLVNTARSGRHLVAQIARLH